MTTVIRPALVLLALQAVGLTLRILLPGLSTRPPNLVYGG